MSRIGKKPISLPKGVEVSINGDEVIIKGPKGTLTQQKHPDIEVEIAGEQINIKRPSDAQNHRSLHGLTRALIANMVDGVVNGFEKKLELVGVGYRAQMKGKNLILNLGFSHPIEIEPPAGIEFEVPEKATNKVTVRGIDKQLLGNTVAHIRAIRPPEPYKGKGIKYENEYIRRKAGKTTAK